MSPIGIEKILAEVRRIDESVPKLDGRRPVFLSRGTARSTCEALQKRYPMYQFIIHSIIPNEARNARASKALTA